MTLKRTKDFEAGGFLQLLHAEWTRFRSVRGWMIGLVAAALLTALPGLILAATSNEGPQIHVGPDGKAVTDKFFFVHQPLTGDGSITVRVTSMTGLITYPPPNNDRIVPGVVPWAKAGIIIKDGIKQGSAYAAIMVTGGRGVHMQINFTQDIAGLPGGVYPESPRWLRLTRSGNTISGYESKDGKLWTKVGTARLVGLPPTVKVGLFVTSPGDVSASEAKIRFANATAGFDHVEIEGEVPGGVWDHDDIGIGSGLPDYLYGSVIKTDDTFTVTGSGDIAPLGVEGNWTMERSLIGVLFGMITVIVVAVRFVTAEYRLPHSQTAGPQRGRVLTAKVIVIGIVTLIAGLATAIFVVSTSKQILSVNCNHILPVTLLTELRVIFGTAALLALAAVFAFAFAVLFRRSGVAVIASLMVIILPYVIANIVPLDASRWLLRLTPAAGFAIQQSIPEYRQVIGLYTPQLGYYPLAPWVGFAVFCCYTALALGLAFYIQHRRELESDALAS